MMLRIMMMTMDMDADDDGDDDDDASTIKCNTLPCNAVLIVI